MRTLISNEEVVKEAKKAFQEPISDIPNPKLRLQRRN